MRSRLESGALGLRPRAGGGLLEGEKFNTLLDLEAKELMLPCVYILESHPMPAYQSKGRLDSNGI
jgi:hypothetical protein